MAITVGKVNYHCPICEKPTYYKSADGWRPFCSRECAKKAIAQERSKEDAS